MKNGTCMILVQKRSSMAIAKTDDDRKVGHQAKSYIASNATKLRAFLLPGNILDLE